MLVTSERNSSHDIDHIGTEDNQSRVLVDHAVPDPAGPVIAVIVRADQFAMQMGLEVLHESWALCILKHACCSSRARLEGASYLWSGIAPSCCIRANPSKSPRNSVILPEARR